MYVTISVGIRLACADVPEAARGLTIVTLSLFAQPGEESLAVAVSIWKVLLRRVQLYRTSRAGGMLACLSQCRRGALRRPAAAGDSADRAVRTSVAIVKFGLYVGVVVEGDGMWMQVCGKIQGGRS